MVLDTFANIGHLAYGINRRLSTIWRTDTLPVLPMPKNIPQFKFHLDPNVSGRLPCIKMHNEVIHEIQDLNEFYLAMGYNVNNVKNEFLPEEYIWDQFTKHSARKNCTNCLQLRIINYLLAHSKAFLQKFGKHYNEWVSAHLEAKQACNVTTCAEKA